MAVTLLNLADRDLYRASLSNSGKTRPVLKQFPKENVRKPGYNFAKPS